LAVLAAATTTTTAVAVAMMEAVVGGGDGDEVKGNHGKNKTGFLIKIRFGFPPFVVLLCLECFRVAQICMQCLSIPFHYVYSQRVADPFSFSFRFFCCGDYKK
jgi:hypothetical protein